MTSATIQNMPPSNRMMSPPSCCLSRAETLLIRGTWTHVWYSGRLVNVSSAPSALLLRPIFEGALHQRRSRRDCVPRAALVGVLERELRGLLTPIDADHIADERQGSTLRGVAVDDLTRVQMAQLKD